MGFHRQEKLIEVNFFVRKIFLQMGRPVTSGQFALCLALKVILQYCIAHPHYT